MMIFKNFLRLFRINWFQTIATVLLLSFLIFFLNILLALTANVYVFSNQLKDKLGVYLYFKEGEKKEDAAKTYELIIDMKSRLENAGLKVTYLSKEKAIQTLSKRLPKIIQNFEKYGIKNPIPPTMYIIFKSQQEYEKMRQIVLDKKYQDILLNLSDIGTSNSFKKQEERVKKIIEFSNFMIKFYIFLSIVLFVIILWFLILIIKLNFYSFYDQIEVEKLIGFSYFQIKLPFLLYALFLVLTAFILGLLYIYILLNYLDVYFMNVFNIDLWKLIGENVKYLEWGLVLEILSIVLISLIVSNLFLTRLIKKI